jgi:hypothetical protein
LIPGAFVLICPCLKRGNGAKPADQVARDGKSHLKMEIAEIKNTLKSHKGQNLRVIIGKQLKTKKNIITSGNEYVVTDGYCQITKEKHHPLILAKPVVEKVTSMVIRGGIEYDNQKVVVEGREDGTLPEENAGLPWGDWAEYPYHITHKGNNYARFYMASGISFEPKAEYYLDGKLTTKAKIEHLCLASEFRKSEEPAPLAMTIKADNVRAIII